MLLMSPAKKIRNRSVQMEKKHFVTMGDNKTAHVCDAKSGQPLTGPMKHDGLIFQAEFSPDGKLIVTASRDDTARVWDVQNGQMLTEPMKHGGNVYWAGFSADGKRIVTLSGDEEEATKRVWDAQSGKPLTEPVKPRGLIKLAQFGLDEQPLRPVAAGISLREAGAPKWLPFLAEAVAGQHLNDHGVFEPLREDPARELNEIREQLSRAPTDDDWAIWGRWFLADRSTRTISPFSKITVPEYIENRIKENTPASLDEAERLAVGNAELLKRIEQARKAP